MTKDVFRTVREILDWPDDVMMSNAVACAGHLYEDSKANLTAIQRLERPLRELVGICVTVGIEWESLDEIIDLIGEPHAEDCPASDGFGCRCNEPCEHTFEMDDVMISLCTKCGLEGEV